MNVTIKPLYFCSQSFLYTCSFKDLFTRLTTIASDFDDCDYQVNEFVNSFLSTKEFSSGRSVYRFHECSFNKRDAFNLCSKYEYFLFVLDKDSLKDFLPENQLDFLTILTTSIFKSLETLEKYLSESNNLTSGLTYVHMQIKEFKNKFSKTNLKSYESIKGFFKDIDSRLKEWKSYFFLDNDFLNTQIINAFNEFSELEQKMDVLFDFEYVFETNIRMLVLLSKTGIINVSLISSNNSLILKVDDKEEDNRFSISNCISCSKGITTVINKLPKCYSAIDFNRLLRFNDFTIFQRLIYYHFDYDLNKIYDLLNDKDYFISKKERESIIKVNNFQRQMKTKKSVFLKFIANKCKTKQEALNLQFSFDYLSVLVGKYHEFDAYTLFEKLDDNDFDLLKETTQHLFVDDGQCTYTVINTASQAFLANETTKLNNSLKLVSLTSHKSRIYSFWDFLYICNCSCYSSLYSMSKILFSDYIQLYGSKRSKHKLISFLSFKFGSSFNSLYESFKFPYSFNKQLFEELYITNIDEDLSAMGKLSWRQNDLSNTRLNYWISTCISIASTAISLFSFGMIAKVYVDGNIINSYLKLNEPPSEMAGLLTDAVQTQKMWLVLIIFISVCFLIFSFYKVKDFLNIKSTKNFIKKLNIVKVSLKKFSKK